MMMMMMTTRKRSVTFLHHAKSITVANTHNAVRDGKVGCDTLESTKALLYSDWLYFYGMV